MTTAFAQTTAPPEGIPLPIVRLNRIVIVASLVLAFVVQQPVITTLLLLVLLGSVVFGPRGSLIFQAGRRFLRPQVVAARARGDVEDRRLMRFNNSIAVMMLAMAQVAFLLDAAAAGWILAGIVVVAATVALLGFCVGCFIFYRFRLAQFRWRSLTS